ncbi:hypothetical protein ANCCEY_13457 [Ancylostoma ceylanicum]|uniref:Protein kinase domain-containing protein n=1 Tax=Ancylostoma ceylanicum TaxID=53326 RepID=A0A0D6L8T4_9BILA|nr:hypothetical protein ANCCEY_13457 [Ancylostoma ceylanicum]
MGYREDYERARLVHILDFGLSRSYAIQSKDGKWVARRARGTAEFRGTLRYCSPNVHEKKEQALRTKLVKLTVAIPLLNTFHLNQNGER